MIPIADAYTAPLVDGDTYSIVANDQTDYDPLAFELASGAAESEACRLLNRTLRYGTYKEDCYLYRQGMVYPSATPIDPTQPIFSGLSDKIFDPTDPSIGGPSNPASVIQGDGVWVGWFTPLPWMPVWTGVIPPQTFIQYNGGYSADGSVGQQLPFGITRIIVRMMWFVLNPVKLPGMPYGATETAAGGVSVAGNLSSIAMSDPLLKREIDQWKRRQAKRW